MNDQLKQRLVGAIVLVSLAVIFLPMIFKGDGTTLDKKNVPPEPDYRFPPPKEAPKAPPVAKAPVVPIDNASTDQAEKKKTESPVSSAESKESKSAEKAPAVVVIPDQQETESGDSKTAAGDAWVVQVGSFSSEPNALALRDKLRKMGFACFVEAVKGKKGMVYRVRVGPELTRELANRLNEDLSKKANLKGLVQGYP